MDWGLKNRLSKIIQPDTGRAVMLAFDHGYFLGPTHRLEDGRKDNYPINSICRYNYAHKGPAKDLC